MSGTPPTTLGKYQIIREIARSNDIVYEAYDSLMNRRVALKELAMPSGSTDAQKDDRLKRFLREAKAAGSLAHPNIVTIYEVGQEGERHYLVMEYLDGQTLRNELDAKGFLPPERALEISTAVLRGLDYAHQNGVIHRDIKPENIQLLSDGRIKLTDFGIARLTFEPNLTMDGQVFGTPSYMSPEQVVGREIDVRSDIFSAGVVLYEMLSGQKPFRGDSVVAITYAIMNNTPDSVPQATHAIQQVINRAIDKSPALRFSSASEMLKALDEARRGSVVLPNQTMQPAAGMGIPPVAAGNPFLNNPYAQPAMGGGYQQQLPYAQPITTPYGQPAGAVPPGAFGSSSPMQQPLPPVHYAYNPYGQSASAPAPFAQQVQPQFAGSPAGAPTPFPAYYPPPPRRPMLKPETQVFLKQALLIFVLCLSVFSIVVLVLAANSGTTQNRTQTTEPNVGTQPVQNSGSPSASAPSSNSADPANTATPPASAQSASPADSPARVKASAGFDYERMAKNDSDPTEKLRGAAIMFDSAYDLATTESEKQEFGLDSARVHREIAERLAQTNKSAARDELYAAEQHTHDPNERAAIHQDLDNMS